MTIITSTFDREQTLRFPVYKQYSPGELPQPAYIYLDLRDGTCGADYSASRGSTTVEQWHNLVLTFSISAATHRDDIDAFLTDCACDLQKILDGSEIVWNGNDNVGKLSDAAQTIFYKIANRAISMSADNEKYMIDDLCSYLADDIFPESDESAAEFAERIWKSDSESGYYFSDDYVCSECVLNKLRDLWAEELYSGCDLPKLVALDLLAAGTCEDSEWTEELIEFSKA